MKKNQSGVTAHNKRFSEMAGSVETTVILHPLTFFSG